MTQDRWMGLGFLLFCALLWFFIIPQQTEGFDEAFVPRLITAAMAIPSAILLIRGKRNGDVSFDTGAFLHATLPAVLLVLAFLAGTAYIGFFVSAAVFLVCALLLFGERRPGALLLSPMIILGSIYAVMIRLLHFDMPHGLLF